VQPETCKKSTNVYNYDFIRKQTVNNVNLSKCSDECLNKLSNTYPDLTEKEVEKRWSMGDLCFYTYIEMLEMDHSIKDIYKQGWCKGKVFKYEERAGEVISQTTNKDLSLAVLFDLKP